MNEGKQIDLSTQYDATRPGKAEEIRTRTPPVTASRLDALFQDRNTFTTVFSGLLLHFSLSLSLDHEAIEFQREETSCTEVNFR